MQHYNLYANIVKKNKPHHQEGLKPFFEIKLQ